MWNNEQEENNREEEEEEVNSIAATAYNILYKIVFVKGKRGTELNGTVF